MFTVHVKACFLGLIPSSGEYRGEIRTVAWQRFHLSSDFNFLQLKQKQKHLGRSQYVIS